MNRPRIPFLSLAPSSPGGAGNGEQDVRDAIGHAVAGDILDGRMLDALPLEGSLLAVTLRTGIPVTAAKPGFLQKLFR